MRPSSTGIAAADVQQKQLARAAANASAREAIAARLRGARGVGDDIGNDENDENADESKGAAAAFPLDFFERTTCVTGEVTFGGDLARRTSSDSLRFALQSEDSHVEAPAPGAGASSDLKSLGNAERDQPRTRRKDPTARGVESCGGSENQ